MNVLLLALVVLLAGCSYAPSYASVETCQLHCSEKGLCPNGFSCSEGYCVRPGEDGAQCFGGVDTAGTVWLCQGANLELKARPGAETSTKWQPSASAKLPDGVSISDNKLVVTPNAKLGYGEQHLTLSATDGTVTKDVDVALDVKRCLEVAGVAVPTRICRGETLRVALKSMGGAGDATWSIKSLKAKDEAEQPIEASPLSIESDPFSGPSLVGKGLAVGSYHVELEVSSSSNSTWAGEYSETPVARSLDFDVEKCALIEPVCNPVAQVAGTSPEGEPVFCVDKEDGIQIECSAKGADVGVTYKWNWLADVGSEKLELTAGEEGKYGETRKFVGRAAVISSDKPWTGNITVFVPDVGDKKTMASVPLKFRTARCPEMANNFLPDATVNEPYDEPLVTKTPVDSSEVTFKLADASPSWMALATRKGTVSVKGLPDRAGKVSFKLQVTEPATGAFSLVTMNLNVLKATVVQPTLEIASVLPAACAGQPYEAVIAEGPVAVSNAWSFADNGGVEWLKVYRDPDSQKILLSTPTDKVVPSGIANRRITVRATGGLIPRNAAIDIPVMRTCKFVYATQTGALKLADLRQVEDSTLVPVDISSHMPGYKVKAFFVSPNGRWVTHYGDGPTLVTRSTAGAGPATEVRHSVLGAVEGVAWASSGEAFAAVTRDTGGRHLQVYVPSLPGQQGASIDLVDIEGVSSGEAESRPIWVGNAVCAPSFSFAELEFDSLSCLVFDATQGTSAAGVSMLDAPDLGTSLRDPRSSFVTDETNLKVFAYTHVGGVSRLTGITQDQRAVPDVHDDGVGVPDPTAKWLAQPSVVVNGNKFAVGIFPFGAKSKGIAAPRMVPRCTEVRNWARNGERLACTENLTSFYVVNVPRDGSELTSTKIDNAQMGAETGLAFTPDGNWFVFFNGQTGYLSRVDLNQSELFPLALSSRAGDGDEEALRIAPTLLPFGREGTRVVASNETELFEIDAVADRVTSISDGVSLQGPCDIFAESMYRWCGSSSVAVGYSASPTADGLVFPDSSLQLVLAVPERELVVAVPGHPLPESWRKLTLPGELTRPCDAVRGCGASFQFAEFEGKANAWR